MASDLFILNFGIPPAYYLVRRMPDSAVSVGEGLKNVKRNLVNFPLTKVVGLWVSCRILGV
ncbi:hypothetical protein PEDI_16880 [Persicobacter diffluens]|uniref:Uncharacterized protein n=1 Tax=Persicobacter diffluens TaxID=981 RepID=A0AAN5AL63_9BACT|nr:hypothetical protein PEDI_16880 [Persicobacter diffluens]